MNHELAKTLTTALVQFIDRERTEGTMCCSSYECEKMEKAFEGGNYEVVEAFLKKKLLGLTEFEDKLVAFALQCGGQWDIANEEAKKWSNELFALVKKDLTLTWKDISIICQALVDVNYEFDYLSFQEKYEEILRRFNEEKEEKK